MRRPVDPAAVKIVEVKKTSDVCMGSAASRWTEWLWTSRWPVVSQQPGQNMFQGKRRHDA